MRSYTPVRVGQLVTLVKIIPFAVSEAHVSDLEALTRESGPVISVRSLRQVNTALIISGPDSARDRLIGEIEPPVRARIEGLGSVLERIVYVPHDTAAIASEITAAQRNGAELIVLAGISAIIDSHDVAPEALRSAGGHVAHFGAPVDPGSLLMVGYSGDVPVIGAPGCIRSPKTNVIDWILPRLLSGERLTRQDIVAMGHGGLLDDIDDRPMPRGSE
jgi:molybdenum cofactor cytidylyltransferase